jgi:hypothetical protein
MAVILDFPANPTVGQESKLTNGITYQWDGQKWNTRLVESYANTGGNPGTSPPPNPTNGTFWWDSENGQLYIYYTDVTSSQWMQAAILGTTYDSLGNVVTNAELSARNLPSGTYDLSLALEGSATYDNNVAMTDLGINLELGQNLTVSQTGDQTISTTDTD